MAGYSALQALRDHLQRERDFNHGWIVVHLAEGHPMAAKRREEIVAERDEWLRALDEAMGAKR